MTKILFCVLLINSILNARPPRIMWTKNYGGDGNESIKSISRTLDKGYIICGTTAPRGSTITDIYLIKLDERCDTLWSKTYGGIHDDVGNSLLQTADSSFIIAGHIWLRGWDGYDTYLLKVGPTGEMIWSKRYGENKRNEGAWSIVEADEGNHIILVDSGAVSTSGHYDAHLMKIDDDGEIMWERSVSSSNIKDVETGAMIQRTSSGSYIFTGKIGRESNVENDYDVWLAKCTPDAEVIWSKAFGYAGPDGGRAVLQTSDGGYLVVGYIEHRITTRAIRTQPGWLSLKNLQSDVFVIKTDSDGNMMWCKTFGGDNDEDAYSVLETSDRGFIIGGYTGSFSVSGKDIYLIKIDDAGNECWSMTYGGLGDDCCFSVIEAHDGGYIAGCISDSFGRRDTDIYVIRFTDK
ncbi:MAG: hypothetical protein JSV53_10175 [candidate division WOR-3 bacterium]|nr:MAG: hypothetical protein JSV53_10175 [candidate division WOR-3 bacterium]